MVLFKKIALFGLILFLYGCKKGVDIEDYINKKHPVNIVTNKLNSISNQVVDFERKDVYPTVRLMKLLEWGKHNVDGWGTSYASFVGNNVLVIQDEFRLLYWSDTGLVVVAYVDVNGKAHQISKTVKKNELDFLLE